MLKTSMPSYIDKVESCNFVCGKLRYCIYQIANNICLFDLILYVPSTIFQLNRDRSSCVEPVLS